MRLFVGLDLTPEIRERITRFMDKMRGKAPDAKWVSPESLHVTLKFIGEQPRERVEEIERALATIQAAPFQINFRACGFFPAATRSARVFWIGVEAGEQLRELAQKVDEVIAEFGVERENDYTPHLTLARARPEAAREDASSGLKRVRKGQFEELQSALVKLAQPEFGTMAAREFFLYESKLSPKGARYDKIARFALGKS
jgi:2'-5' RNA ligase